MNTLKAEGVDRLLVRLDEVIAELSSAGRAAWRLDARVGRLEGWCYETRYRENLASHLVTTFDKPRLLVAGNVPPLVAARRAGEIDTDDWARMMSLDVLAWARDLRDPAEPEVYVAIELSQVIDESDVERAHERAAVLRRVLDQPVVACVDGEAILIQAEWRAQELGVLNLRG